MGYHGVRDGHKKTGYHGARDGRQLTGIPFGIPLIWPWLATARVLAIMCNKTELIVYIRNNSNIYHFIIIKNKFYCRSRQRSYRVKYLMFYHLLTGITIIINLINYN